MKILPLIKSHPYYTAIGILILVLLAFIFLRGGDESSEVVEGSIRTVETVAVGEYSIGAIGVAVPTADGSSFVVRAESGGRVNKTIPANTAVKQGAVIAVLDNGAQLAELTRAEGVYEAALASGARSDISVTDSKQALTAAKQSAVDTNRAALTAWNDVLYNTVDDVFSNPRSNVPGVRISSDGKATYLNDERVAMKALLETWQNEVTSLSANNDTPRIKDAIEKSISRIDRLATMLNTIVPLLAKQDADEVWPEATLVALRSEFATAQSTLNTHRANLLGEKTALTRAEDTVSSASIAGTGGEISAADATIKQALGGYQAAQAAYSKTIVKAPFTGRVTSLNVRVGDIISVGTDVAIVQPNDGVETERAFIIPISAVKYTPENAYVFIVNADGKIESIEVETGLVTANSIKVTGLNGDENIISDVRGLKTGQSVSLATPN
ncbi:hypothetical protein H6789_01190 [Candidatus Nomurabacteria bacterium]|nr:hypothetical protein [Candidatus Nomurabacteria bacterium]